MKRGNLTMNDIQVLIVDPQTLLREGLASLLSRVPGITVVDAVATGAEALRAVAEHGPDVILMEVHIPGMNGIATTREICSQYPTTRVLIVTNHENDEYVYGALAAGAAGYLLKDTDTNYLIDAIRKVYANRSVLDPAITHKVIHRMLYLSDGEAIQVTTEKLTEREQEVLRLVASGASNVEIAQQLYLAEGTVRNHVSRVLNKLNARDRAHAVRLAIEWGLINQYAGAPKSVSALPQAQLVN